MFDSNILEIALGMVFIFMLVSILCTAVREGLESWLKTRAAFLEQGLRELLNDVPGKGLAARLYQHPLIYGLFAGQYEAGSATGRPMALQRGHGLPSYIPAASFASALLDLAAGI